MASGAITVTSPATAPLANAPASQIPHHTQASPK